MSAAPSRRPPPPIPVTVLTGFLGAGKTTLLNELLRDEALSDAFVLINEFGEVGLDHLLVERLDGDMLLMASGCICCSIRGDLVAALEGLLRRLDNGRLAPIGRVVIETTGLADPVPVLQTIIGHPYFALRFRLDGVVTVIDAVNGLGALARHGEAVRQVVLADAIVVTKTDLAEAQTEALLSTVTTLNARAPVLLRAEGQAGTAAVLAPRDVPTASAHPDITAGLKGVDHEHHGHDRTRHGETIRSLTLVRPAPISGASLSLFLDLLRHGQGQKVLRLKGLVALEDDPQRPLLVHAVGHLLHPPVRLDAWPDGDRRTRIVVIVDGLEPSFVQDLFDATVGEIAPDRPDAAVLADNPLAKTTRVGLFG